MAGAEAFPPRSFSLSFAFASPSTREPMFPLYDDNPTEIFPLVTVLIMGACVAVWLYVQGAGMSAETLAGSVCAWGAIPSEITGRLGVATHPAGAGPCPTGGLAWPTLVTSMFLHGSWMHLIGNLWFLWIFGNNVEDSMGHGRFLLFYLLSGLVASGSHIASAPASPLPMVGASGAISAIMGAYLLLYPQARVYTLFIIIIIIRVFPLPAWFFLLYWFLIQVASSRIPTPSGAGGVAFWAHIGGFLAGVALVMVFRSRVLVLAKRSRTRIRRRDLWGRGWW
jgi:membrane associated rhomboid family serine protease